MAVSFGDGSEAGATPMLSCAAMMRRALSLMPLSDIDPFLMAAVMLDPSAPDYDARRSAMFLNNCKRLQGGRLPRNGRSNDVSFTYTRVEPSIDGCESIVDSGRIWYYLALEVELVLQQIGQ
jgi:hypothetical protein